MNYANITTCDVCNGEGLGVVLWVTGCDVHCHGCHNPETWDPSSGNKFTSEVLDVLVKELSKDGIDRLTLTGGHPLMPCNRETIKDIIKHIRKSLIIFVLSIIKILLY